MRVRALPSLKNTQVTGITVERKRKCESARSYRTTNNRTPQNITVQNKSHLKPSPVPAKTVQWKPPYYITRDYIRIKYKTRKNISIPGSDKGMNALSELKDKKRHETSLEDTKKYNNRTYVPLPEPGRQLTQAQPLAYMRA